ncbi:glycosyltransferase family 4 protein, partial [Polaribacter sp.]|uniref:glycosyltransferase family 4 protein n=1 Tax=Polaribacter sp. TaxID=1920175 RepID=UPI004048451F
NHKIYNQLKLENVSAIELIPNGVNTECSIEKNYSHKKRIVSTSRLTPQKNIESLIISFSKLLLYFDDIVLCIYGDGPLRENLIFLASSLNIPKERILFFGNVNETKRIFNYGDIFVLPSFVEGMSNSLLEAMSLGIPCVVSNIQENVEVFSNKDAALFFDPYNNDDFVEKLKVIIESDSLYDYLSFKAKDLSVNKYDIEFIAENYINIYKKLLSS